MAAAPQQLSTFLSGVLNIGAGILPIVSAALAPVAAIAGPLSNGLMELVSLGISQRDKRYTLAPLFGVSVMAEKTITFDVETLENNRARLAEPEARRALSTIRRLAGIYCKYFPTEVKRERARGANAAKLKELVLGGLATTPVLMGAAGSMASMAGSVGPFVKLAAGAVVPVLAGSLHVAKRPAVAEALANAQTKNRSAATYRTTTGRNFNTSPSSTPPLPIRPRASYPHARANARQR
jgi:hypothetical protein